MERCPTCQARLKDAVVCPRCGTEIIVLQQIDKLVEQLQYQAVYSLEQGDLKGAMQAVEQALMLKTQPFLITLKNFIHHQAQELRRQRLMACVETFLAEDELFS